MALDEDNGLNAAEQAQMDAMQAADAPEGSDGTAAEPSPPETPAAPSEAAAETATESETEKPALAGETRPRMVDIGALHEERERRKDLEHRNRVLEERTNLILQRINQPAAAPAEDSPAAPPPLDQDPVGHIVGQQQLQGRALEQVARLLQAQEQRDRRATEITSLQQRAMAMEREYRAETPDYDDAVAYLLASQDRELRIAGFTDPAQRQKVLGEQALGTVARALQRGENPAKMVHELAKARGYTAKPPPAATDIAPAGKISQIAAGQQQARSVGAARGSGGGALTAQRLVEMSDAEFLKMMDTPEGRDQMGR